MRVWLLKMFTPGSCMDSLPNLSLMIHQELIGKRCRTLLQLRWIGFLSIELSA